MSKLLDLDELNQVEQPYSRSKNIKTYEYLLEQCHNKVKEYNKVHRSKHCYYKPPVFLIGRPMYDYYDLMNFIVERLVLNGLMAQVTPQGIFICWDQRVLDQMKYQQARSKIEGENRIGTASSPTERPKPKPKPKPVPKPKVKTSNPQYKRERNNLPKPVNVINIENDEFPVNVDSFNKT
jgi:hypothetical protein